MSRTISSGPFSGSKWSRRGGQLLALYVDPALEDDEDIDF